MEVINSNLEMVYHGVYGLILKGTLKQVMERSTFSKGSGESGGDQRDLRFWYECCNCSRLTSLRIVKSHGNPTRGNSTLFVRKKECTFFKWCSPIEPIEEDDGVESLPTLDETDGDSLGLILASIDDNNRAIQKLASVVKYGFSFFVIVMLACILMLK
ncbi:uncharacterized protein LOC125216920 [Salvia hispanica]|uniref:uncharacterized protein LOC125216920 n=1 Tax=Salvia hispanica TaxID=49212 RepID=UPI002009368B|nr:uncharacterized protein LOC125216920 [Salvia hispanica]